MENKKETVARVVDYFILLENRISHDFIGDVLEEVRASNKSYSYEDIVGIPEHITTESELYEWFEGLPCVYTDTEEILWDKTFDAFATYFDSRLFAKPYNGKYAVSYLIQDEAGSEIFESALDRLRGNGYVDVYITGIPQAVKNN